MRDVIFALMFFGILPTCYRRPFIGLLMFSWLGYMRAQDLTWGFARKQRWSYVVAMAMIAGWFRMPKTRWFQRDMRSWIMLAMCGSITVGLVLSPEKKPPLIWDKYLQYWKIIMVALFTTSVVNHREHLRILVWVIALSFGFFGVKTGVAGVLSGGSLRVLQGPGGMLEDNNDFSLALCMALPLLVHIGTSERRLIFKRWMKFIVPMTALTVILTYSRGGFLSLTTLIMVLVWRSPNRLRHIAVIIAMIPVAWFAAPAEWKERIATIGEYETEGSAQGRLQAWATATRMAVDNPVWGVGMELFQTNYSRYAKPGEYVRVAHNSYFQVWAECGTVTLLLYLSLLFLSFWDIRSVRREARRKYRNSWIIHYASMFEATLATFMVGSTFLNRAHFDLIYHYVAIIMCFTRIAREEMARDFSAPTGAFGYRNPLEASHRDAFRRPRQPSVFEGRPILGSKL